MKLTTVGAVLWRSARTVVRVRRSCAQPRLWTWHLDRLAEGNVLRVWLGPVLVVVRRADRRWVA